MADLQKKVSNMSKRIEKMEEMNYLKSKVENFDQNAVEKYRSLKFEADPSKK